MRNQNCVEKIVNKLFILALIVLLPCLSFGAGPVTVAPKQLKSTKIKRIIPKGVGVALKPAMKIQSITFKTAANGDWTFFCDYKNTGLVTFPPHQLQFKSTQILTNGMRIPIHTVTYNRSNTPGAMVNANSFWDRCSNASKLMMEVIYKGKVLDRKTVTVPAINVHIKNISVGNKIKCLLKNNTGYNVKVALSIVPTAPRTGPQRTTVIPANSTKNISGIDFKKESKKLQVLFKDEKRCSGKGYIVLNTKTLPATTGYVSSLSPKVKALSGKVKKDLPKGIMQFKTRKAEIINFEISTDQNGKWFWEATVRNTGTAILSGQDLIVQGNKRSYPHFGNDNWTPASGSIVGPGDILPSQTKLIRSSWARCCQTGELKLDLRDNVSNLILDTETKVVLLLGSGFDPHEVDVRVKSIEWKDTSKSWQATLKNMTSYTTTVKVQGYHWKANTSTPILVGTSTITLGPDGENSSAWWHVPNVQHGDSLKIHRTYIMGDCNESKNDCGFQGSNNIIIPNSYGI